MKGQVAIQTNLQERTEIEASSGKCEISTKILRDSYSAAPIESTLGPSFCRYSFVNFGVSI